MRHYYILFNLVLMFFVGRSQAFQKVMDVPGGIQSLSIPALDDSSLYFVKDSREILWHDASTTNQISSIAVLQEDINQLYISGTFLLASTKGSRTSLYHILKNKPEPNKIYTLGDGETLLNFYHNIKDTAYFFISYNHDNTNWVYILKIYNDGTYSKVAGINTNLSTLPVLKSYYFGGKISLAFMNPTPLLYTYDTETGTSYETMVANAKSFIVFHDSLVYTTKIDEGDTIDFFIIDGISTDSRIMATWTNSNRGGWPNNCSTSVLIYTRNGTITVEVPCYYPYSYSLDKISFSFKYNGMCYGYTETYSRSKLGVSYLTIHSAGSHGGYSSTTYCYMAQSVLFSSSQADMYYNYTESHENPNFNLTPSGNLCGGYYNRTPESRHVGGKQMFGFYIFDISTSKTRYYDCEPYYVDCDKQKKYFAGDEYVYYLFIGNELWKLSLRQDKPVKIEDDLNGKSPSFQIDDNTIVFSERSSGVVYDPTGKRRLSFYDQDQVSIKELESGMYILVDQNTGKSIKILKR